MFHASSEIVLVLFCTDGCFSVVDKKTDAHCFMFYVERGGEKKTGITRLHLQEKDRRELSTRCLMPALRCHTLLLFFLKARTQRSNYTNSTVLQQGYHLSSFISLILMGKSIGLETHQKERHFPQLLSLWNPVFPQPPFIITKWKLKQLPFHVKDSCTGIL